jgi:hypothetical protein
LRLLRIEGYPLGRNVDTKDGGGKDLIYLHDRSPRSTFYQHFPFSSSPTFQLSTHQKCTVLSPIGLSHILLAQLWAPAGAAVLCHLLPCCWNRALVDRNACAWLCAAKNCDCRKAGRAARRRVLGAGMMTLLFFPVFRYQLIDVSPGDGEWKAMV